jgi:hypothetical protein
LIARGVELTSGDGDPEAVKADRRGQDSHFPIAGAEAQKFPAIQKGSCPFAAAAMNMSPIK